MKITLIEDEKKLAASLTEGLEGEGYEVSVFYDGILGEKNVLEHIPDLVILDLMLPSKDGFEICKTLRKEGVGVPILVLTARDSLEDKINALDSGADDFVSKPFSFNEVLARLRALTRRSQGNPPQLKISDLTIDIGERRVFRAGKEIYLTFKEFELLEYLIESDGKVKTREEIYEKLWERKDDDFGNVVDVHIRHLRQKIDDNYDSKIIRTVRGVGYAVER
ncbi:MAG: response regulator transcription factor [Patescibacteria group bacterium]